MNKKTGKCRVRQQPRLSNVEPAGSHPISDQTAPPMMDSRLRKNGVWSAALGMLGYWLVTGWTSPATSLILSRLLGD